MFTLRDGGRQQKNQCNSITVTRALRGRAVMVRNPAGAGLRKQSRAGPSNMLHYETSDRKCFQLVFWWMHSKSGERAPGGHTEHGCYVGVLMFYFHLLLVFGTCWIICSDLLSWKHCSLDTCSVIWAALCFWSAILNMTATFQKISISRLNSAISVFLFLGKKHKV